MESRLKLPLSYKENIPKNLFLKPYPSTENKKKISEKTLQENLLPKKQLSSYIYYRKIPKMEDKKIKEHKKLYVDSFSEIRLPLCFIDYSYDSKKIE